MQGFCSCLIYIMCVHIFSSIFLVATIAGINAYCDLEVAGDFFLNKSLVLKIYIGGVIFFMMCLMAKFLERIDRAQRL